MINSSTAKRMAPARRIVSVLLVVLLVFCPLMEIRAAAANIEDIILILWSALRSCAINIAGTASSVVSFLYNEITDFAAAAGKTVTDVIYGLGYSVNAVGEFIINDTFVDFINDFISFFIAKYDLSDNESVQLTSSNVTLDGMTCYAMPLHIQRANGLYTDWSVYISSGDVYGIWSKEASNSTTAILYLWSYYPSTVKRVRGSNNGVQSEVYLELVETADNGIYWIKDGTGFGINDYLNGYDIYLDSDVHTALTELPEVVIPESPIYAYTQVINAPSHDINFTIGDGAQINIGAPWGSSIYDLFDHIRTLIGSLSNQITIYYHDLASIESQVPKPSDVENLPAGTIYNINGIYQNSEGEGGIRFGGIWHYVTEWVEDFTEAAPIIWYVVTNSPDQIVNILYATVVLTVVIGFIHKARSH